MGGSVGKGLSVWGHSNDSSTGKRFSKSGQNSPVTPSHFGCRTVGVAMLIKSGNLTHKHYLYIFLKPVSVFKLDDDFGGTEFLKLQVRDN